MKKRADGRYDRKIIVDGVTRHFYGKSQKEINEKIKAFYEKKEKGKLFTDVADEWWEEKQKAIVSNSRKGYKAAHKRLVAYFDEKYINEITAQNLNSFINWVIKTYDIKGKKTIENHLIVVRGIFEFACIQGYLQYSPADYLKPPRNLTQSERRFPTDDEIAMVKISHGKTFGLFYYMIMYTGCRPEELLPLRWGDIDFEKRVIHIDKAMHYDDENRYRPAVKVVKTNAGKRDVPLLDKLYPVLREQKRGSNALIFPNTKGEMLQNKEVWRREKQYQKETGLYELTPYQLRHAFATMCYEAGLKDKDLQTIVGHKDISTSKNVYIHIRKQRMEEAVKKLNEVKF